MSGKLMVDAQVWDAQNKALRDYEDDIKRLAMENEELKAEVVRLQEACYVWQGKVEELNHKEA